MIVISYKIIVNCITCIFCCIENNKNYTCTFKKCNMGRKPYYSNLLINLIVDLGEKQFLTCNYTKKKFINVRKL